MCLNVTYKPWLQACHLVRFIMKRRAVSASAAALAIIDWCIDRLSTQTLVASWWVFHTLVAGSTFQTMWTSGVERTWIQMTAHCWMVRAPKHVNRPSLGCAGAKPIAHGTHKLISSFLAGTKQQLSTWIRKATSSSTSVWQTCITNG